MSNTPSNPPSASGSPGSSSPAEASPSPEQVLAELELIAGSDVFAGAARQQRLLRHLVTKRLNGLTGDLKEYTLGVEVFDRGEEFDPRLDPIVRVEASRLRSRLQKYYDGGGALDPVRILLPRGGYSPCFGGPPAPVPESPAALPPAPITADPTATKDFPGRRYPWSIAAAIALLCLAVYFGPLRRRPVLPGAGHFTRFKRVTNDQALCSWPTFSPDDQAIAYARRDAGTWQLYLRDLKTSAVTELTPGAAEDNFEPAWAPDGRQIAFRSDRDGGGIYLLDVHSRATKQLVPRGYNPSWAPDSTRLVFSAGNFADPVETGGGGSSLLIADVRNSQVREVTSSKGPFSALQPAWSPHGTRIAYWDTDPNGDRDIWTIDPNSGNQPVPVTRDAWTDWSPAWSPDGKYLYFASDRGGSMNLWRIRIDEGSGVVNGQPEPVTTPSSYTGWLSFAHTGDQFAYVSRIPFDELYRTPFDPAKPVDLAQRVQLTSGERGMHEPDMSPDGQWIVVRVQDPQEDLALIKFDGSSFRRLTNDLYTERNPRWSPDGKQIVFTSNRNRTFQMWSIRPDGTGLRQLTRNGIVPVAWTPDGTLAGYPADGAPIAIDPAGAQLKDWGVPPVLRPLSWSPDRSEVAGRMRAPAFGNASLFLFTPATQDYWEISPNASNTSIAWIDNGRQLLFSGSEGIYLADARTHQVKQELSTARNDVHSRFTMSKDSRAIYYVQSEDEEDIWMAGE